MTRTTGGAVDGPDSGSFPARGSAIVRLNLGRIGDGQGEAEQGAASGPGFGADPTAVGLDHSARDREAQARSASCLCFPAAVELLEHPRLLARGEARAPVR